MARFLFGFLSYLFALVIFTALGSPLLWWWMQAIGHPFADFRAAFNATVTIAALLLLAALLYLWGLRGWRDFFGGQSRIGLRNFSALPRQWAVGFAVATAASLLLIGGYLALGWRVWTGGVGAGQVATDFVLCMLLGVHEEFIFRGVFFLGALMLVGRYWKEWAVVHALFFAFGHYLKAKAVPGDVTWLSGWHAWSTVATGVNWPECANTAVLGLVLCLLARRTRALWMGIGLHGGFVFWIRSLHRATALAPAAPLGWVGANLRSGWMPLALLLVILLITWRVGQAAPRSRGAPSSHPRHW